MCSSSLSLPLSAFLSLSACLSLPLTPSWCLSLPPTLSVSLPPLRQRGSNEPHPGPRGPLETLVHCLHCPPLPFPLPGSPYVVQRTIFALEFTFNSRITGCTEHIRAERRVGRGPAHPCCCRWTLWSPGSFLGTEAPCSGDGEANKSEAPWKARHSREAVERVWFFPKQGPTHHLPGDGRSHRLAFPLPAGSLHTCLHEPSASCWLTELHGGWHRLGATHRAHSWQGWQTGGDP